MIGVTGVRGHCDLLRLLASFGRGWPWEQRGFAVAVTVLLLILLLRWIDQCFQGLSPMHQLVLSVLGRTSRLGRCKVPHLCCLVHRMVLAWAAPATHSLLLLMRYYHVLLLQNLHRVGLEGLLGGPSLAVLLVHYLLVIKLGTGNSKLWVYQQIVSVQDVQVWVNDGSTGCLWQCDKVLLRCVLILATLKRMDLWTTDPLINRCLNQLWVVRKSFSWSHSLKVAMLVLICCWLLFLDLLQLDEIRWGLRLCLQDWHFIWCHAILAQDPEVIVPKRTAVLHMVDFVFQSVSLACTSCLLGERLGAHISAREFTLSLSSDWERSDQFVSTLFGCCRLLHILQIDSILAHDKLDHGLNFALGWICSRLLLILITDLR